MNIIFILCLIIYRKFNNFMYTIILLVYNNIIIMLYWAILK